MAYDVTVDRAREVVVISLTAHTAQSEFWLSRTGPSGNVAFVRGCAPRSIAGDDFSQRPLIVRDFEAPLGVPLTYTLDRRPPMGEPSPPQRTVLIPSTDRDDPWLVDIAQPNNTTRIVVEALHELDYEAQSGVHYVLDRRTPIVTSDVARAPSFELQFVTLSRDQYARAHSALGNGVPVLLRTDPGQGVGNLYFVATGWKEQRVARLAQEPLRRFLVEALQVLRPDPATFAPSARATYQGIYDLYPDYQYMLDERVIYDNVLNDPAAGGSMDVAPWPPVDV